MKKEIMMIFKELGVCDECALGATTWRYVESIIYLFRNESKGTT